MDAMCCLLVYRLETGNFLGAVHLLSLTHPGISSNIIIRAIIPNVIEATKFGIEITDWNRDTLTVFCDIVAYKAD